MKPTPSIDRALVHRIGAEEAVDVVGAQVRDHFRRRHRADLHVGVGIDAVLREIVAQQVVVHRIVERHRELEALPLLRIALVLVLDRERDRLAVDVLHRRHRVRHRIGADAERDRERHRRQHVGRVVFLVQRLVADHRPAGGLDHFDVEAVLRIEAHRLRHDDRRGAGDRDEADLEILLLDARRPARTHRSRSRAGRTARAQQARSRRRPISGTRAGRRPAETPPASPRRRPRPRSASLRSGFSTGTHCS